MTATLLKEPFIPPAMRRKPKKSAYGTGKILVTVFYDQGTAKFRVERGQAAFDSRMLPAFAVRGNNKDQVLAAIREGQDDHEIPTILGLDGLMQSLEKE